MNIRDLQTLYQNYYWANHKILDGTARVSQEQFVAPTTHSHKSLRGTLAHLVDGEHGWRTLCQHRTTDFTDALTGNDVFGALTEDSFPTVGALAQRWNQDERAMRDYLAGLTDDDMTSPVRYTTGDGDKRERPLWHCLYHLVTHGTQHRSEAAAMLTDYSSSPGELDFTAFLNENPQ